MLRRACSAFGLPGSCHHVKAQSQVCFCASCEFPSVIRVKSKNTELYRFDGVVHHPVHAGEIKVVEA